MATKKYKVGIVSILDIWNPEVDIDDYRIGTDGKLEIEYEFDETFTERVAPQEIAGWFGGRFVKWVYDEKQSLDGMVIEKTIQDNN